MEHPDLRACEQTGYPAGDARANARWLVCDLCGGEIYAGERYLALFDCCVCVRCEFAFLYPFYKTAFDDESE